VIGKDERIICNRNKMDGLRRWRLRIFQFCQPIASGWNRNNTDILRGEHNLHPAIRGLQRNTFAITFSRNKTVH
jgi:hypothetical protein